MTVQELIEALQGQDPKAPVYTYDADWDVLMPVRVVSTKDPRANPGLSLPKKIHKHAVILGEL